MAVLFLILWAGQYASPSTIRTTPGYFWSYLAIAFAVLILIPETFLAVGHLIALIVCRVTASHRHGQTIRLASIILSGGVFLSILFALIPGKNQLEVRLVTIPIKKLPPQLVHLKIVQLSDLHLASFHSRHFLKKCREVINKLEPDLIVFTGDMVNNYAGEMDPFNDELRSLHAPLGKYAILGNHDYGDYSDWKSHSAKIKNHLQLLRQLRKDGFRVLQNESVKINYRATSFYLCGTENWGEKPFPQYGNLTQTLQRLPRNAFSILLTHDPSFWSDKIAGRESVALTLSGHTHGGQLGFKFAGIEFSPMVFIERYWGGLYMFRNQYLYVNRGLGTVGFHGRLDMPAEITVLQLISKTTKLN